MNCFLQWLLLEWSGCNILGTDRLKSSPHCTCWGLCQTAKFTTGTRCPQHPSLTPTTIQRDESCLLHFKRVVLAHKKSSSFPARVSDAINNAILSAVQPVSVSHQRLHYWPLIGGELSMLASHWSMSAPPSPMSHLSPASLQLLLLRLLWVSQLGLTSVWDSEALTSFSLGRCLEMSELVKFSPHCFQAINCNSNKSQLKQSAPCLKIRNF